jgi:hypothetical protein
MSRNLQPRPCPNCGANIQSVPNGGRILCEYCGQSFDIADPSRVVAYGPGVAARQGAPKAVLVAVAAAMAVALVGIGAGEAFVGRLRTQTTDLL